MLCWVENRLIDFKETLLIISMPLLLSLLELSAIISTEEL